MGRHGGINILHQKSWHVWRMDNRLRVERDELQHAAKEAEQRAADRKEAFQGKLLKLRSVAGLEALEPEVDQSPREPAVCEASSSRSKKQVQGDDYGKYGVTKSNLKKAENQLKSSLQNARVQDYWGKEGLGSGPHINLFESAELEVQRHHEEHAKLLRYQGTNNNLAEKSKKRPLSEFDEMTQEKPWYMKAEGESRPAAEVEAGSDLKRKWRRKHGQLVLQVIGQERSRPSSTDICQVDVESDVMSGSAKEVKQKLKDKERKKDKKGKKHRQDDEHKEIAELRRQRHLREEAERQRASALRAS